jgi:hypothetical protein
MLHYKKDSLDLEVPERIILLDSTHHYYGRVLEIYLEESWHGSELLVFKIKDTWDDWWWPEEMAELRYMDYDRVKNLLIFL